MTAERVLLTLLLGGIAVGCVLVLYPFLSAILWAAILTYTTWPIYEHLRTRLNLGRTWTAGLMVLITAVVIVLPLALAVPSGADDADHLRHIIQDGLQAGLPGAPGWVAGVPVIGQSVADLWNSWAADLTEMVTFFKPYFGAVAEFGLTSLLGLANGVLMFLLALFVAFFFYASGDRLAVFATATLQRIAGDRAERLIGVTGATVRGVVYGILGTAIVQGILVTFGLWLSGVPRALLLGVVAGSLSVLADRGAGSLDTGLAVAAGERPHGLGHLPVCLRHHRRQRRRQRDPALLHLARRAVAVLADHAGRARRRVSVRAAGHLRRPGAAGSGLHPGQRVRARR